MNEYEEMKKQVEEIKNKCCEKVANILLEYVVETVRGGDTVDFITRANQLAERICNLK